MMSASEVYVLEAMRTPIVRKNGKFRSIRPEILGAEVLRALIARCDILHADGVIAGNAVGTGGNLARLMALEARLPAEVPAVTIDMQCASGAAALDYAYARIASGQDDLLLAGGMESASLQPLRIYDEKDERRGAMPDGAYRTAQFSPGELAEDAMIRGAERVAQAEHVTKAELDEWTLRSHRLATKARAVGLLHDRIVPVAAANGWREDDGIREKLSQQLLDRLPLLFGAGSLTTAGNSCLVHDGAAFAVLASGRYVYSHGMRPVARILGVAMAGGDPRESPRGAMRTADLLLRRMHLDYGDLAAIEFNEAFAVIDVLFAREHPDLLDRYCRYGGALAYGHPYGASGGILLVHLLTALREVGGGMGLLSIAGAGGMGEAILVEAV